MGPPGLSERTGPDPGSSGSSPMVLMVRALAAEVVALGDGGHVDVHLVLRGFSGSSIYDSVPGFSSSPVGGSSGMEAKRGRVAVVVLGDIGRSPRMQYHALSLAEQVGCLTYPWISR